MAKYNGPELKNSHTKLPQNKTGDFGEQNAKYHGDISFKPRRVEQKQKEEEPSLLAANTTITLRH